MVQKECNSQAENDQMMQYSNMQQTQQLGPNKFEYDQQNQENSYSMNTFKIEFNDSTYQNYDIRSNEYFTNNRDQQQQNQGSDFTQQAPGKQTQQTTITHTFMSNQNSQQVMQAKNGVNSQSMSTNNSGGNT